MLWSLILNQASMFQRGIDEGDLLCWLSFYFMLCVFISVGAFDSNSDPGNQVILFLRQQEEHTQLRVVLALYTGRCVLRGHYVLYIVVDQSPLNTQQHSSSQHSTPVPSFDNLPENWIWWNLGPFHSHLKASLSIFIVSPELTKLMLAIGLTADTCVHQQFLFRTSLTLTHTSGLRPVKNR